MMQNKEQYFISLTGINPPEFEGIKKQLKLLAGRIKR
jgi:hypothetical protein